jgi:hypothetical protein
MKKKIVLKIKDLEFDNTRLSVGQAYRHAVKLLRSKGHIFNGIFLSVDSKTAYAWRYTKFMPPSPPTRRRHG